jgi:AbrB family looped-hinge helix DNA binding protein
MRNHEKETTVITERGQVSIPASLRKELALSKGQRLTWQRVGDRELRVVVVEDAQPPGALAMLGFGRRLGLEFKTTAELMAELREGET